MLPATAKVVQVQMLDPRKELGDGWYHAEVTHEDGMVTIKVHFGLPLNVERVS